MEKILGLFKSILRIVILGELLNGGIYRGKFQGRGTASLGSTLKTWSSNSSGRRHILDVLWGIVGIANLFEQQFTWGSIQGKFVEMRKWFLIQSPASC